MFHVTIQKRKVKVVAIAFATTFYMLQIWLQPSSTIATRNYSNREIFSKKLFVMKFYSFLEHVLYYVQKKFGREKILSKFGITRENHIQIWKILFKKLLRVMDIKLYFLSSIVNLISLNIFGKQ